MCHLLAYYLLGSSCSERMANKLGNQDCCLLLISFRASEENKKIKGSQDRRNSNEIGKWVCSKCRSSHVEHFLVLLLGMRVYVEMSYIVLPRDSNAFFLERERDRE